MGSLDPYPEPESVSGSSRAKITTNRISDPVQVSGSGPYSDPGGQK